MENATNTVIPFQVTRYRCPYCDRTGSKKSTMQEHANSCIHDPKSIACPTCDHDRYARLAGDNGCILERMCSKGAREYGATFVRNCPAWELKAEWQGLVSDQ